MGTKYKLSVRLMTYMHSKYIKKAMESILMQKANFPIEVVIGDDFSSDGTLEIVRKFKNKNNINIKVLERNIGDEYWRNRKKNGRLYNFINTLENCSGDYIAFLDGDDYWIDPYKLQKQVDFLEANPEYGLVHTDYNIYDEKKNIIKKDINKNKIINEGDVFEDLLIENFITTATVCVRADIVKDVIRKINFYKWNIGDKLLWLELAKLTKIGYLNETTAVYRNHQGSASHQVEFKERLNFFKSSYKMRFYYIYKYGCSNKVKNTIYINYYKGLLKASFLKRDKQLAEQSFINLKKNDKITKKDVIFYYGAKNLILWIFFRVLFKVFHVEINMWKN